MNEDSLEPANRELLLELALLVAERRSLAEVFGAFAEGLLKFTSFAYASLAVHEADRRFMRVVGSFPASIQPPSGADAFRTSDTGIEAIANLPEGAEFVPASIDLPTARDLASSGIRRGWSIAIAHDGRLYGLLTVGRVTSERFAPRELEFLRAAARLLTGAVVEESHVREALLDAARNRIIGELAVLLGAGEPVEALFGRLQALLEQALDFDYLGLSVLAGPGTMRVVGTNHPEVYQRPGDRYPAHESGTEDVLATGSTTAQYRSDRIATDWGQAMSGAGFERFLAAVLVQGDTILGVLDIGRRTNLAFTADDEAFAALVATLLAQSVANGLRLERSETEASRGHFLNELAVLLTAGEPVEALFSRVRDLMGRAFPFDYIGLAADDGGGMLRVVGAEPPAMHQPGDRYPLADSQIGGVVGDGAAVVQFRTDRVPGAWPEAFARLGMARMAVVVLRHRGKVNGLFSLGRRQNRAYTPEECAFVEVVGALLGQAIGNQVRLASSEAEAHRAQVLNELAVLVNAGESAEALFDNIRAKARQAFALDFLALHVATPAGFRVVGMDPDIGLRASPERAPEEMGLAAVFAAGQPVAEYRPADFAVPAIRNMAGAGLEHAVSALLGEPGSPLGVLTFARRDAQPFAPDEVSFIAQLATFLAQAEANQRRIAAAEAEAHRAGLLTGLALLLNAGEPVAALFDRLTEVLGQALDFDTLVLFGAEGERFIVSAASPPVDFDAGLVDAGVRRLFERELRVAEFRPEFVQSGIGRLLSAGGARRCLVVTLRHGPARLGALGVGRLANVPFSELDQRFLDLVGTLLAQAMAGQARLAESENEAERARALNELSILVNSGEPLEGLIGRLHELLSRAFSFDDVGLVARLEPGGGFDAIGGSSTRGTAGVVPSHFRLAAAELEELATAAGYISELRPEKLDHWFAAAAARSGIGRMLLNVLREGNEIVGLLGFGRASKSPFSERDRAYVEVVGTLLAQAIAARMRLRASEIEAEEQRVVAEVAAIAARTLDPESIVREIVEPIRRFVPRPFATVGFVQGANVVYPTPGGEPWTQPRATHTTIADEAGQASSPRPLPEVPGYELFLSYGVHAMTLTVCEAGGAPVGYLIVGSRREGFVFGERELRLLRLIAQITGPAIANVLATQRIARERATYDLALTSLKDAVLLIDRGFKAVFTNPLGEKLADAIDPSRVLNTLEANLAALPEDVRDHFNRAVTRSEHVSGRTQVSLAGIPLWFDFDFIPLDHPDLALLVVASDVTAEMRQEEEREHHREEMEKAARLAALGELIGGVAHELNNPLTAILGFAELMAKSEPSAANASEIEVIRKEALRARDIVRDLLFIARPGRVERGDVLLGDVIGHVERLRRPVWTQERIDVTVDTSGLTRPLHGNEHQLTQVLLNLITNAENAVRDNPRPCIRVRAHTLGQSAVIEVEDNGHGMDAATRDRIFEPFFTTRHGDGTGLGLSLSYSIVAAHEGKLDVESRPGAGTVFRITLPISAPEGVAAEPVSAPEAPACARALVIDDEPSLRVLSQRLITSMGHECSVAPDSATAVALAGEKEFDVVICDYRLATETADAVVAGFQEVAPHLVDRMIIATGATTDPGVVDLTRRHNLRLVAKPYGIDEIAGILAEYAARRQSPPATTPAS